MKFKYKTKKSPLHSTMFPINRKVHTAVPAAEYLYIPLCFLLIHEALICSCFTISLYIPLCFLLIPRYPRVNPILISSLHSTMFPINRCPSAFNTLKNALYIPLCFLLIDGNPSTPLQNCKLYIPLCFLLIYIIGQLATSVETLYIPLCFLLIPALK